jgi:hypothetical protein
MSSTQQRVAISQPLVSLDSTVAYTAINAAGTAKHS